MDIRIALAGNPNCGKTTLFNLLTGSNQFVGNWPGVTVEKKEGKLKGRDGVIITDLPGIYSLSPYSLEEVVARNYLVLERPDAILNIVDGTNLERNLYLTTQLTELGIPVVVAINMMDIVRKKGDIIDTEKLEKKLGCKIVEISALKGTGIEEAAEAAICAAQNTKTTPRHSFSGEVEHAIAHIEEAVVHHLPEEQQRWYAIKIFERDPRVIEHLGISQDVLDHIEQDIKFVEDVFDDDAESIITNDRYNYITESIRSCFVKKHANKMSTSDKIDSIVTNRFLAIPIFALVMFIVYFVSVTTVGTFVTDWTNDVLFGEIIPPAVTGWLEAANSPAWLVSLIVDGIIGGVGAVLGFVPQMLILFMFLAFLEACGYMSRIAFVLDKIFRKFGLSGKSFIPMLVGTGCSVPGIMCSRTIENERDRRMTIITTSFIPCSAKLPVIALIAGVIGQRSALISTGAFFIGIVSIIVSGIILKKTKLFEGDPAPFVMELPSYHMPTPINILRSMWERGWSFIKKAGTVILLSAIVLWFMQSFGFEGGMFTMVEDSSNSLLSYVGRPLAYLFIPLGFGFWQAAVAVITGLIAKENIVATFGVLYGVAEVSEEGAEVWASLQNAFTSHGVILSLAAVSFLVFNLLCAPCFAAVGAIRREMNSKKWTWFALGYQTVLAYCMSLLIYQFGLLFTGNVNIAGIIFASVVLAFMCFLLFRPERKKAKK